MAETKPKTAVATKPADTQETSSHISVHPLYSPSDLEGWNYDSEVGYPGQFPYTRGVQATMYRGRLWTMRQYAGMGDADESNRRYKYLLSQGTTGLSVAFDLADPDRPGFRQRAGHRRSRQGRRGHRFHRRHDAAVRRHQHGKGLHVDDHQRFGRDPAGAVHRDRAAHRPRRAQAVGDNPERCAEGIHRPRHLHLSAGAGDAHHHRHFFLCQRARAGVEHHLHLRLSHARGRLDCGAGSGLHAGQRHDLRAGRDRRRTRCGQVRAAAFVLLQRAQQFSGRSSEVSRGPAHVGAHHARSFRRQECQIADAALPHSDGRLNPDRAAAGEQHRPHRAAGHGGGAGRNAVAAYQFVRRSAGVADRAVGAHRAAHAADHRLRIGCGPDHRSAGRLVLHGVADQPDREPTRSPIWKRSMPWAAC